MLRLKCELHNFPPRFGVEADPERHGIQKHTYNSVAIRFLQATVRDQSCHHISVPRQEADDPKVRRKQHTFEWYVDFPCKAPQTGRDNRRNGHSATYSHLPPITYSCCCARQYRQQTIL